MQHTTNEPTVPTVTSRNPERTCIGCRQVAPAAGMFRCVATPGGAMVSRTAPGRGAWLCSAACFHVARRKHAFQRAWRRSVDPHTVDELLISFEAALARMEN